MRIKANRVKKLARVITDPIANFISLVGHAATEKPFTVVKEAEPIKLELDDTAKELLFKTDEAETVAVEMTLPEPGNVLMQRMEFDKSNFGSEEIVKKYIDRMGFTDYTIAATNEQYIVRSIYFEQFGTEIGKIEGNVPGVHLYVGKIEKELSVSKATTKTKTDRKAPLLKGMSQEDLLTKYDYWSAWWSDDTSLAEVMEEGLSDGIPPGFYEVTDAFSTVVANASKAGDMEAIKTAATDMGNFLVALIKLYNTMMKSDDEGVKKMAEDAKAKIEKTDATEPAGEAVVAAVEKVEEAVQAVEVAAEAVATEIAPAVEAVVAEVAQVAATVESTVAKTSPDFLGEVKKMFDSLKTDLTEKLEKSEERLAKLEGTATQKRSIEANQEEAVAKKAGEADSKVAFKVDANLRNTLGI